MSSVAVGTTEPGPGPEPKRRRLLDAGGPIKDDETARRWMRGAEVYKREEDGTYIHYAGFDPNEVACVRYYREDSVGVKPMSYFAMENYGAIEGEGELQMMRWLYVNGADTGAKDEDVFFPMYEAAHYGNLEVCKWLFEHGAAKDIKRRIREDHPDYVHPNGLSPLSDTFGTPSRRNLSRWLILNGALCKDDDSGDLDVEVMKEDLGPMHNVARAHIVRRQEREALLEWATDLHRARFSFLLFMSGARSAPQHAYRTRRSSPLKILSGNSGFMELIGDYIGIVRGREATIVHQLTEMLPDLIDAYVHASV